MNEFCQRYNIGDTVVVREWDDMKDEFGLGDVFFKESIITNRDVDGAVRQTFSNAMKIYCDREAIVYGESQGWYLLSFDGDVSNYFFSDNMLVDPPEDEEPEISLEEFLSLL